MFPELQGFLKVILLSVNTFRHRYYRSYVRVTRVSNVNFRTVLRDFNLSPGEEEKFGVCTGSKIVILLSSLRIPDNIIKYLFSELSACLF